MDTIPTVTLVETPAGWGVLDQATRSFTRFIHDSRQDLFDSGELAWGLALFARERYGDVRQAEHRIPAWALATLPEDRAVQLQAGGDIEQGAAIYAAALRETIDRYGAVCERVLTHAGAVPFDLTLPLIGVRGNVAIALCYDAQGAAEATRETIDRATRLALAAKLDQVIIYGTRTIWEPEGNAVWSFVPIDKVPGQ